MGVPALPVLDEYTRKGAVLFARQAVRFNGGGSGTGVLRLRESPDAGALPTADVAQIYFVNNSGIRATPWTPLPRTPFIEADGAVRSTRLIPRIMHTTGVTLDSWVIEVGYLSWT